MADRGPAAAQFDLTEALARLTNVAPTRSVELLRRGTLRVKYYEPRGHDPQTPHEQDELYVVARGTGTFFDGAARRPVSPGTLLFVAAGRAHRFEDFTPDFGAWVIFFGPPGGEDVS